MSSTVQRMMNNVANFSSNNRVPATRSREGPFISASRAVETEKHTSSLTPWHQSKMPLRMKSLRKIRPLLFRLVLPILHYRVKKNADTTVAGLQLGTSSQVFHPKYFFSSKILARYLATLIGARQKLLDMGTGSGVIGIMAAKHGAEVLAVDLNPSAVALAIANARRHGLHGHWRCLQSDLFAHLDPAERFDWIVFNPPYFPNRVQRPAQAAWHAGENYETIERFLAQAQSFLVPHGKIVLILSSDMPLSLLHDKFRHCGYDVIAHAAKPHLFEIFHLLQLQRSDGK
ncbi:MAG: methyltransferase [bacterium]